MTDGPEPPYERIRTYLVRDAMTTDVAVARLEDTLLSAAQVMRERKVSGLPVIGPHGVVVGVLSERDIVDRLRSSAGISKSRGILDLIVEAANGGTERIAQCAQTLKSAHVGDAMTRRPVTIEPDEPLSEAARWLHQAGIHRLPVVEDRKLVGIVTRDDILRMAVPPAPRMPTA
ncbi:MAG TPA: CBS domain-containing protein [Thermoplasmata archaeon]|nr:CBS domain-containing protein [Thermoplasmata archaeon]